MKRISLLRRGLFFAYIFSVLFISLYFLLGPIALELSFLALGLLVVSLNMTPTGLVTQQLSFSEYPYLHQLLSSPLQKMKLQVFITEKSSVPICVRDKVFCSQQLIFSRSFLRQLTKEEQRVIYEWSQFAVQYGLVRNMTYYSQIILCYHLLIRFFVIIQKSVTHLLLPKKSKHDRFMNLIQGYLFPIVEPPLFHFIEKILISQHSLQQIDESITSQGFDSTRHLLTALKKSLLWSEKYHQQHQKVTSPFLFEMSARRQRAPVSSGRIESLTQKIRDHYIGEPQQS